MCSKKLTCVNNEKDLGVHVNYILSWDNHVYTITAKGTRCFGCLKKQLTNTAMRRTLYLSLMKSQLSYGTEVWSPPSTKLISRLESVQRRATAWILKTKRGEKSYKQQLITLGFLPLCYEKEIRASLRRCTVILILTCMHAFVSFVNNGRTCLSKNPSLTLKF